MNPFEEKVTQFANDEIMFNSIKGIFLGKCDLNTIENSDTSPDFIFGQRTRAWLTARDIIEEAFKEIKNHQTNQRAIGENKNRNGI